MEQARVKFESDPEAWAWIKGDIAEAKEGRPCDEARALAICEARTFNVEKVRASYAEARAIAKGKAVERLTKSWSLDAFWELRPRFKVGELVDLCPSDKIE